jgi:hypothetical protein
MLICALAAITATIIPLNIQWIVIAVIVLMYTLSAYYIDKWLSCN